MNKVLSRSLFNRGDKPQKAHGTGITKLVVGEERGYQDGGYVSMFQNMSPARSYEQILAEREKALGEGDMGMQTALALMALGGRIASTPGGLLTSVGASLPEFSATVGKAASDRERQLAALRVGAAEQADRERAVAQSLAVKGLETSLSETRANKQIAAQFAITGTETWAMPDSSAPSGYTVFGVRRTPEGIKRTDGSAVPNAAFPADASFLKTTTPEAKTAVDIQVMDDRGVFGPRMTAVQRGGSFYDPNTNARISQPFRLFDKDNNTGTGEGFQAVVLDSSQPLGLRPVTAFTDKTTGKQFYLNNGTRVEFDSSSGRKGSLEDMLKTTTEGGSSTIVPSWGPYANRPFKVAPERSGMLDSLPIPANDPEFASGRSAAPPAPSASPVAPTAAPQPPASVPDAVQPTTPSTLQDPEVRSSIDKSITALKRQPQLYIGAITGEGPERYFVRKQPEGAVPYTPFSMMTGRQVEEARARIGNYQRLLNSMESMMKAIPEATGPWSTVKQFSTNYVVPFAPDSTKGIFEWYRNTDAKRELDINRQEIRASQALNPRFPVGELAVIDDLVEKPAEFWANPQAAIYRFQTLARVTRNMMELERAQLENRSPLYLERVPTGTRNDPFEANQMGYLLELKNSGVNLGGVYYRDAQGGLKMVPKGSR